MADVLRAILRLSDLPPAQRVVLQLLALDADGEGVARVDVFRLGDAATLSAAEAAQALTDLFHAGEITPVDHGAVRVEVAVPPRPRRASAAKGRALQ